MTQNTPQLTLAKLIPVSPSGEAVTVQFNPTSLQYSITNTLQEQNNQKKQYVTKSSATVAIQLIFDTTHSGQDVRSETGKIAKLMKPQDERSTSNRRQRKFAPVVKLEWGTFIFQGVVQSYKENLDFFAPAGVPLRATLDLSIASQEKIFELDTVSRSHQPEPGIEWPPRSPSAAPSAAGDADRPVNRSGPPPDPNIKHDPIPSAHTIATALGNPQAARVIATANGLDSLRFNDRVIVIDPNVTLAPPTGLGTGRLSAGIDLRGAAASPLTLGVGGAALGQREMSGLGIGGQASAGVAASAGAFARLRQPSSRLSSGFALDPNRLLPDSEVFNLSTNLGANVGLGGQAKLQGSAGLTADVGTTTSLRSYIQFEED